MPEFFNTLREKDSILEREISKFLDLFLYSRNGYSARRSQTVDEQIKGVDLYLKLSANSKELIVDEKAQGHYVNMDLPTFAFEVNYKQKNGLLGQGWLFDERKATTHYLLIWIFAVDSKNICIENIKKLRCILVDRIKLQDYLKKTGWDINTVSEEAKKVREVGQNGKACSTTPLRPYLYYSSYLAEKPINIVVRRQALENLSDSIFVVSKDEIVIEK